MADILLGALDAIATEIAFSKISGLSCDGASPRMSTILQ
jgi:hypothetical protein